MSKDVGKFYKDKYKALRAQYIKNVQLAYRQGFEAGAKQSEMQQFQAAQAQQAQLEAQQAAMMGGGAPGGQPGQEGAPVDGAPEGAPGQGAPDGQMFDGNSPEEMDQLIEQLQAAIQKSEGSQLESLQKSLDGLKKVRQDKKSMSYALNLGNAAKKALSTQEKLVENLVKKWNDETPEIASKIEATLRSEPMKR